MSDKKIKDFIEMLEVTNRLIKINASVGGMTKVKATLEKEYNISENGAYLLCKYVLQNVIE